MEPVVKMRLELNRIFRPVSHLGQCSTPPLSADHCGRQSNRFFIVIPSSMGYIPYIIAQAFDLGYIPYDISQILLQCICDISRRGESMNAKEAVARRIKELCAQRNIAINGLANLCGVPPSTIYSMLNAKSKNPGVVSIQKICDGLEISVRDFFNSTLFENLEQEVK
ncbi:helix-turn-helix domain-containing protein [Oscillibacter ruminantium]|uniref:helix-turn-helix domain-containing protein n=1 Tax=Oscillibacter ruminantium TaxID=1263547 RepID=UPI00331D5BAC